MYKELAKLERIERLLLDTVESCRGSVLDTFEVELGENPNWKFIRGRLLRAFGDRGLAGRVTEILKTELNEKGM